MSIQILIHSKLREVGARYKTLQRVFFLSLNYGWDEPSGPSFAAAVKQPVEF